MIETTVAGDYKFVQLSAPVSEQVTGLRDWLHTHVYMAPAVEGEFLKASRVLRELFNHFKAKPG